MISGQRDEPTFAIGDIHGCRKALERILARCAAYAQGRPHRLVFIGDYIDRGPDSRGVIEIVRSLCERDPENVICLMGNHEELLLDALSHGGLLQWLANGGMATLQSYGISDAAGLPDADIEWLRSLRLTFDDGKRFFVHAGVDPDLPLASQPREALLWIRERFHRARTDYGRLIIHGHTPVRTYQPDIQRNRINIDTGCVYGGVLTAAVFTNDSIPPVKFLSSAH